MPPYSKQRVIKGSKLAPAADADSDAAAATAGLRTVLQSYLTRKQLLSYKLTKQEIYK